MAGVIYNVFITLEIVWQFHKKLSIHLYNLAVPLLSIHPRKMRTYFHRKSCTQMTTESLLIIVQNWKQSKYLTTGKWISKF